MSLLYDYLQFKICLIIFHPCGDGHDAKDKELKVSLRSHTSLGSGGTFLLTNICDFLGRFDHGPVAKFEAFLALVNPLATNFLGHSFSNNEFDLFT